MPRAPFRAFEDRELNPRKALRAINEFILEPGDQPVTLAEFQKAYESVEVVWRPKRIRDEYGRLQPRDRDRKFSDTVKAAERAEECSAEESNNDA